MKVKLPVCKQFLSFQNFFVITSTFRHGLPMSSSGNVGRKGPYFTKRNGKSVLKCRETFNKTFWTKGNCLRYFIIKPPSALSADVEALVDSLDQTFDKIELMRSKVLVVGDFNGTNSSWCSLDQTNTPGRILHQTFLSLGLHQSVSFRTHLDSRLGNLISLLDLLLVSEEHLVEKIDSLPPLGASDHVTVYCRLRFAASKASQLECRRIWCYNKADRKALNAALSKVDWSYVQQAPDTDSAWLSWKSTFLKIAAEFVPSKKIRKLRPKLPWITEKEEQEIKLKHSLFRKFKKSRLQADRVAFQRQRTKLLNYCEEQKDGIRPLFSAPLADQPPTPAFDLVLNQWREKELTDQFLILSQTLAQHCKIMWTKQMLSMSSSRSRLSFKEMIVNRIPQACQRIHITFPPLKHHRRKSTTYCCLCQRRKHLGGTASQLTCYVCVPLVLQRV